MGYYPDFRVYLDALKQNGMLVNITRPIIKETQLGSLVRLQFRGLPEEQRKGFLFENVTDTKNKKYQMRVATGVIASSKKMYAFALQCKDLDEVMRRWAEAQKNPFEPRMISRGPVQEEVYTGSELNQEGRGLDKLPVPVEVPGYSGQIRTTYSAIATKDLDSGKINIGIYSGHIFGKTKILAEINPTHHGFLHWQKARSKGMKSLEAAIVVGAVPPVFYTAAAVLPYGVNEYAVAGGLMGEPLELVKCKTVDLEVPAASEIVIEGKISTEYLEPGTSLGEIAGYMTTNLQWRLVFDVTCISHRHNAIFTHVVSQMPPSESSMNRHISYENVLLKFLRDSCGNTAVKDVGIDEISQDKYIVIKLGKTHPSQAWQALYAAASFHPHVGKMIIAVDDDIDPRDHESVIWALSWRMQPHRDVRITRGKSPSVDPSGYAPEASPSEKNYPDAEGSSVMLIDATIKWPYPPTALPKKEYMEDALKIWKEEGLPTLTLRKPWYGYELGYWPEEYKRDANMILNGEFEKLGQLIEKQRKEVNPRNFPSIDTKSSD